MDEEDLYSMLDQREDAVCACGAEKNPGFPLCFMCSKQEQVELDDWAKNLQRNATDWNKIDPFS